MTILEDPRALDENDPSGMLPAVAASAAAVRSAAARAGEAGVARLGGDDRPRAVVCLGEGTSGLASDTLGVVAGAACPAPVVSHRGGGLPGWVGALDAVVAVSHSGASRDVLSGAEEARRRGSRLLGVGAADSPLQAVCTGAGAVYVTCSGPGVAVLPGGARTAFWALAVPVLMGGEALGLFRLSPGELETVAMRLESVAVACRVGSESFVNPAKALALTLQDRLPLVWGSSPAAVLGARRFAQQLAATAKSPCLAGGLPEAVHHAIGIFDGPYGGAPGAGVEDLFADPFLDGPTGIGKVRLVLLRDAPEAESPAAAACALACAEIAADRGVGVSEVVAEGVGALERLAYLVGVLDWTAVYLALLLGLDPADERSVGELGGRGG